jgi:hypothetical protein
MIILAYSKIGAARAATRLGPVAFEDLCSLEIASNEKPLVFSAHLARLKPV